MNAGRLLELTVSDLALIDRLRLTLEPGLNVITGETGGATTLAGARELLDRAEAWRGRVAGPAEA